MDAPRSSQPFQSYLLAGERILWTGQPKQGLVFSGKDILLVPFSLMWGGIAIAWNAAAWFQAFGGGSGDGPDWFFRLWGLPFLVVGLYLIAGRFLHDASLRRGLHYAVTDQRVLVVRGAKFISLDIRRLPRLDLAEYRDGSGTLAFEADHGMAWGMSWGGTNGFGWWVPALASTTRFFRIRDARKVYELVRNQAHG